MSSAAESRRLVNLARRLTARSDILPSGCWQWRGASLPTGYGVIWNGKGIDRAHRVSYRVYIGEIPEGAELDHVCRNRGCVNPSHLECVTHRENIRRSGAIMGVNARKTHCIRGHHLSGDNLHIDANGSRQCRTCERLRAAKRRAVARNG